MNEAQCQHGFHAANGRPACCGAGQTGRLHWMDQSVGRGEDSLERLDSGLIIVVKEN